MYSEGYLKQLSVLAGLVVGYIIAIFMGKVDLGSILSGGFISLPHLLPVKPEFHAGAIVSTCIIFLVSAAETIGDTSALVSSGLDREITGKKFPVLLPVMVMLPRSLPLFGCPPVTSFSQNVGLVAMTKVVNRFTIMTGAVCMILAGLSPPIGNFFRFTSGFCCGRMYHYDVRFHSDIWCTDDRFPAVFPSGTLPLFLFPWPWELDLPQQVKAGSGIFSRLSYSLFLRKM